MTTVRGRGGFTLLELSVAIVVLMTAMAGVCAMMNSAHNMSTFSHEMNCAVFDVNSVIGFLRNQPFQSLTDPDYHDAYGGARLIHGGVVDKALYCEDGDGTMTHLEDQEIIVYYLDEDGNRFPLPTDKNDAIGTNNLTTPFAMPDPVSFEVECTWRYRNATRSLTIGGMRTR